MASRRAAPFLDSSSAAGVQSGFGMGKQKGGGFHGPSPFAFKKIVRNSTGKNKGPSRFRQGGESIVACSGLSVGRVIKPTKNNCERQRSPSRQGGVRRHPEEPSSTSRVWRG
jgi:hypothetical protein